jgi:hypothetical protein
MTTTKTIEVDQLSKDFDKFFPSLLAQVDGNTKLTDGEVGVMLAKKLPAHAFVIFWLSTYDGDNKFVNDVKGRYLNGGKPLSVKQIRALVNVAIAEHFAGMTPPEPEPEPEKKYKCFDCGEGYDTYNEVRACFDSHRGRESAPKEEYEYRCGMYVDNDRTRCDFKSTDPQAVRDHRRAIHYKGLFDDVEQSDVDLSEIPDGRYACPDLRPGKGVDDYIFLTVKTRKRHNRSKKYRYGYISYGIEEVQEGTREVRLWHGDAKELVGEARPMEFYRGDHVNEFKIILRDPVASTKLFGRIINACGRCGKTLTDPESRKEGIGPDCIKLFHSAPGTDIHSHETKEELRQKLVDIGRNDTSLAWL